MKANQNGMNGVSRELAENWCFLIVSLMQKFQRTDKKSNPGKSEEYINFRIYEVRENENAHKFVIRCICTMFYSSSLLFDFIVNWKKEDKMKIKFTI